VSVDHVPSALDDDTIGRLLDDPALIETHEQAAELIDMLDREIANITAQIEAAEMNRTASTERGQNWLRRATYARAMRINERIRVRQRDKEIRGTKGPAQTPPSGLGREESALKQQRLMEEASARRAARAADMERERTRQMELARAKEELKASRAAAFERRFVDAAKRLLPSETYRAIVDAAKQPAAD
jgi:hypothetical protein